MGASDSPSPLARLGVTPREADVLWAVVERLRNREIAERLSISVRTVESHIAALLRKLDVADRRELITRGLALRAASQGGPSRLPTPFTSFVGRKRESEDVSRLLRESRLVTLLGPPGIGKTRLALKVAAGGTEPGAAMFADLTTASSDPGVVEVVARASNVVGEPDRPLEDVLLEATRELNVLLVLDNCEHVIAGAARLASQLLHAAPGLRILATSRQPLGLPGETTYLLQPMSVPKEDDASIHESDAVGLFVERARAAIPSFELDDGNSLAIAQICRRLDGLPLAIELVAPRLRAFGPEQIAELLRARFEVLQADNPSATPRHRTLRDAIEWSYELLEPEDQILFDRLAIFPDTFDYDAVLAVCADADVGPDQVARIFPKVLDRSMVSAVNAGSSRARYRLLESLRLFATIQLQQSGEMQAVAERHASYYLELAEEAAPALRGSEQGPWLDRLEVETANFRTAIERAIDRGDTRSVARFIAALALFWDDRGLRGEAIAWMRWLSGREIGSPDDTFVDGLNAAAQLLASWDLEDASVCAEHAMRLASANGSKRAVARGLQAVGWVEAYRNKDRAMEVLQEASRLFTELGDVWNKAIVTQLLSLATAQVEPALRHGLEAVRLFDVTGDSIRVANALCFIAIRAIDAGVELDTARSWLERSLALAQARESQHDEAHARLQLARLVYEDGDARGAEALLRSALSTFRRLGDVRCMGRSLFELARLAKDAGDLGGTLKPLEGCIRACERVDNHTTATFALELLATLLWDSDEPDTAVLVLGAAQAQRQRVDTSRLATLPRAGDLRRRLEEGSVERSLLESFRRGLQLSPVEALEHARGALEDRAAGVPGVATDARPSSSM